MDLLTSVNKIDLESGWKSQLSDEFKKPYMLELKDFLKSEYKSKKIIYPNKKEYFSAFNLTPFNKVKVVILGQDPYHGPNQAHGLCFSVKKGVPAPPSLINIYKELKTDLNVDNKRKGDLSEWAQQGVLLINSVMTVEDGKAASHRNRGWETFTDRVISVINERATPAVFILWGSYAQKKAEFVDRKKHLVLESPHPSPLSAHRGFLGCKHFSKANAFLSKKGQSPIDWELSCE